MEHPTVVQSAATMADQKGDHSATKTGTTMADQMAASTSMAGQKEVTTADWMVQTTATTMVDHSATKMDGRMVQTMAG